MGEPSISEPKPKHKSKKKSQGGKKQRIEEQSPEFEIREPQVPLPNDVVEPPRVSDTLIGPGTVYHEFLKGLWKALMGRASKGKK